MKDSMVIALVGPTASGKTSLAIKIAQKVGGEVISVDSRQIYRDLDIGTEKITEEEKQGIPHHMIDVVDPEDVYTVEQFQRDARLHIQEIITRGNIPILAGGSGQYMDAVLYSMNFPQVPPNEKLRKDLAEIPSSALFTILQDQDPERAKTIDPNNKQRIIRALEIVDALGEVPKQEHPKLCYNTHYFGIDIDRDTLRSRIEKRLDETLSKGLIDEVQAIRERVGDERINEFGLEYRITRDFLDGNLKKDELREKLLQELVGYAKRQITWFKKNKDIVWLPQTKILIKATTASTPQV